MSQLPGARLVNKQFNSPLRLYSPANVAEALNKQTQVLANGAVGIDFNQLAAPNLANSAVLRMLEEEERQRGGSKGDNLERPTRKGRLCQWPPRADEFTSKGYIGYVVPDFRQTHPFFSKLYLSGSPGLKRVAWPPPPDEQDLILEEQPVYSKGPAFVDSVASNYSNQGPRSWTAPSQQPLHIQSPPVYQPPLPVFEPPPATVLLRPEAPISQLPPPIIESQPAATKATGARMRGDEKWPPAEHKARSAAENEARLALARGPAVRPRKVKKDYSTFFAQHALTPNYPGYRAPPGTQHYVEEGTSNF